MIFKEVLKEQHLHKQLLQLAMGAKHNSIYSSYIADLEICSTSMPGTIELSKLYNCQKDPEVELVQHIFKELKNPSYLKLTLNQKKTVFFDGKNKLFSYPFIINCAHRHYNPELSEEENKELYYKCFYPHGHEYQLFITVKAENDFTFEVLKSWGEQNIIKPFDKSFLNYKMGNTSGELILEFLSKQLLNNPHPKLKLVNLTLKETFKNSFVKTFDNELFFLF